ncbi:nucleotidyltransferase family protein [Mongoliitalea daihaiensis]|uniref:nucleotidyltransferase family protein n=1 Tax=Mongoliitalea daihaiensis TaxID=2782006 RepID=UPI001F250288|nr:nucleotidyltransferase family protein [Mongoliitalea daihaiensis]UJP66419.1 nucleotidyltransferase family protein [Mongoliitalea daihaiensis]
MLTQHQIEIIKNVTKKAEPTLVGVFGSYARGEENVHNDMDILIDFEQPLDLLELIGLEQELSEELGIKVDLLTPRSIHQLLQPYIQKNFIKII